jgi:hypothetical protein
MPLERLGPRWEGNTASIFRVKMGHVRKVRGAETDCDDLYVGCKS